MHESISEQAVARQVGTLVGIVSSIRDGQAPGEIEVIEALGQGFAQLAGSRLRRRGPIGPAPPGRWPVPCAVRWKSCGPRSRGRTVPAAASALCFR
jgi:hypothetical protein